MSFYLITLTLTVIGYGDSVSMPSLTEIKGDYKVLVFIMLLGLLAFSQVNA